MLYGLRTVRKSWPLFIFDVCALCLIITALIYGVLHFNGSELYLSNGEALGYASQHITGRSIDLDGLAGVCVLHRSCSYSSVVAMASGLMRYFKRLSRLSDERTVLQFSTW